MEFRLASINELFDIKDMYRKVVENMRANSIEIWNDIYPVDFLENDIKNNHLYILCEKQNNGVEKIIAAMCLSQECMGENEVEWIDNNAQAMYIDRFAVNVDYLRQGFGGMALKYAMEVASSSGLDYLRFFVVYTNIPAVNLYLKSGFTQAKGMYKEHVYDDFYVEEYGYEIKV